MEKIIKKIFSIAIIVCMLGLIFISFYIDASKQYKYKPYKLDPNTVYPLEGETFVIIEGKNTLKYPLLEIDNKKE